MVTIILFIFATKSIQKYGLIILFEPKSMKSIIVVFNLTEETFDGYKDYPQASSHTGIDIPILKKNMNKGVLHERGVFVGKLILHKSKRGGKR